MTEEMTDNGKLLRRSTKAKDLNKARQITIQLKRPWCQRRSQDKKKEEATELSLGPLEIGKLKYLIECHTRPVNIDKIVIPKVNRKNLDYFLITGTSSAVAYCSLNVLGFRCSKYDSLA